MGKLKDPIILLGNVRSGTTMMQFLFGTHPSIVTWFEPRTIWMYADPRRAHDHFDERDATPRVKRYIRSRFHKYQVANGDRRIMEKTPSNLLRIPFVHAIFPEARYLYLVREPLAYLSSSEIKWKKNRVIKKKKALKRLREVPKSQVHVYAMDFLREFSRRRVFGQDRRSIWGVRYPGIYEDLSTLSVEEVIAKQWVYCSRQAARDLPLLDPSQVLTVRYEDFVENPVDEFSTILDHFGLELTAEIERRLRKDVDPSRRQKWRRMDPEALARCRPILSDEMARHGYSFPEEIGSAA